MDYIELKIKIHPIEIVRDVLIAQLGENGFESFVENENGVDAYIQKYLFKEDLITQLAIYKNPKNSITYTVNIIEDENWNEIWEHNFEAIKVANRCMVRAPFHKKELGILYDIVIEPKMSFGTGHHETTHLMIERLLHLNVENLNILDMGCGTGVLAILCKMKKANNVMAIDIDQWAYNNTLENIERNNFRNIDVKFGGAELIKNNIFDIIIANINRNILLADMKKYVNALKLNGLLLLSGFFSSDKEILLAEAKKNNLNLSFSNTKNDWMLLELKKTNNA